MVLYMDKLVELILHYMCYIKTAKNYFPKFYWQAIDSVLEYTYLEKEGSFFVPSFRNLQGVSPLRGRL